MHKPLPNALIPPDRRRRAFLQGAVVLGGASGAGFALTCLGVAMADAEVSDEDRPLVFSSLRAAPLEHRIGEHHVKGLMSFTNDGPPPVLRARAGESFVCEFDNALGEDSTVHWHGLRVPNVMDGVPWVTQLPVPNGKRHRYEFVTEDAGTYWYHPHCNTLEQMARGLTGVFIVEEREPPPVDAEIVLNLRDFRLDDKGSFLPFSKPRSAARGGTHGTVMTANWGVASSYDAPAGGLVRLRLAATDVTRMYRLSLSEGFAKDERAASATTSSPEGDVASSWQELRVLALDGHPLDAEALSQMPVPTSNNPLVIGPGQRADLLVRMPRTEGRSLVLEHHSSGGLVTGLATLRAIGRDAGRELAEVGALPPNPLSVPDLARAERLDFVFGWSPDGDAPSSAVCGGYGMNFWSINREAWTGDEPELGEPLATLERGASYVFRLRNETRYRHPIHLHGMTFRLLSSDRRTLVPHWTDTALLEANETIEIALVADNPGDWVFHCHVIEHQKTGLAGFVRVA